MVMAPASTGSDKRSRIVVTFKDQTNRGTRSNRKPDVRMLKIVVIKLIDPRIDDVPARCKEKIARSTDGPACAIFLASGG